jgi:hypothetical protein
MKTIMVRYRTQEDHAETNAAAVRAVFEELETRAPSGFRYVSYCLPDGATFVHVATLEIDGVNPLTELPAFAAFQRGLAGRCVEPPVVTEVVPLGRYPSVA